MTAEQATKGMPGRAHKGVSSWACCSSPAAARPRWRVNLAPCLSDAGWTVSLVTGSLGVAGEETHAPTFFAGLDDVHALDYSAPGVPMHPSYEDRPDALDPVLARVPPAEAPHLAALWDDLLVAAGGDHATLFHLHHLTPQHEAVVRRWPDATIVGHLHGTELKFLEAVERSPDRWPHSRFWAERLRAIACRCDHLVAVNPEDTDTAVRLLGVDPDRITPIPNGVDIERFSPRVVTPAERRTRLTPMAGRRRPGARFLGRGGALLRRRPRAVHPRADAAVRGALHRGQAGPPPRSGPTPGPARARDTGAAPRLGRRRGRVGGEHPYAVAQEVGAEGVFFTGWRGHDDLPLGLAQADVLVMPSVNDSYPQTPLEAMAAGYPCSRPRAEASRP